MYAPLTSASFDNLGAYNFEIRAVGNPEALLNSVRTAIHNMNPDLSVDNIKTATELVTGTLTSQAVVAELSAFFGGLVLVLVCVGLYGSMALGAPRVGLIWMVTREACIELAIGSTLGIVAAIAATHLIKAMLLRSERDGSSLRGLSPPGGRRSLSRGCHCSYAKSNARGSDRALRYE